MEISVIIPALNEGKSIVHFLELLRPWKESCEIILVDGGSVDDTAELARPHVNRVISSGKGRARQMNKGAFESGGDVLLFLHADTVLPCDFREEIERAIDKGHQWGRFDVQLSGGQTSLRLVEFMMNWRSRLTGIATGDQGIFIRRDLFERMEGFREQPLMEDIEMCARLKRNNKPFSSFKRVQTSSRRWEENGIMKTIAMMWYLRAAYFFGVRPEALAKIYR